MCDLILDNCGISRTLYCTKTVTIYGFVEKRVLLNEKCFIP